MWFWLSVDLGSILRCDPRHTDSSNFRELSCIVHTYNRIQMFVNRIGADPVLNIIIGKVVDMIFIFLEATKSRTYLPAQSNLYKLYWSFEFLLMCYNASVFKKHGIRKVLAWAWAQPKLGKEGRRIWAWTRQEPTLARGMRYRHSPLSRARFKPRFCRAHIHQ